MEPKIRIVPIVAAPGTGNQLFQLAFAYYLSKSIPNSTVYHFSIPEIGIQAHPEYESAKSLTPEFKLALQDQGMAELLNFLDGRSNALIQTTALGMNQKYFAESRTYLQSLFPTNKVEHTPTNELFDKGNHFLCHIRGSDIWERYPMSIPGQRAPKGFLRRKNPIHPNYSALPLSYYEEIQESSGKMPIFLCERANPTWYLNLIAERFGKESIMLSGTVKEDFGKLQSAHEIALGISSFSWMASFLGNAEVIHLPIRGLFDSSLRNDLDLSMPGRNVLSYRFTPHEWSGNKKDRSWIEGGLTIRQN